MQQDSCFTDTRWTCPSLPFPTRRTLRDLQPAYDVIRIYFKNCRDIGGKLGVS